MNFTNKVCIITGGALGIGRCLTREFTNKGARVAFIDSNKKAGEENLAVLRSCCKDALFFHGDIAEENVLRAFADQITSTFGRVDCLINNACISRKGILSSCSYEDFNYVLRVGVTAPYMLTQLLLPCFAENASIVNISSSRAFMSQADTESYTAAKGAITALTHALAVSLGGTVRVNSIAPGWINTGAYYADDYVPHDSEADIMQHPSAKIGDPMDIARAALFLCDEKNSFINGENITVDGGMTKQMIYHGDHGWTYNPLEK